jgi:hypothetical protein
MFSGLRGQISPDWEAQTGEESLGGREWDQRAAGGLVGSDAGSSSSTPFSGELSERDASCAAYSGRSSAGASSSGSGSSAHSPGAESSSHRRKRCSKVMQQKAGQAVKGLLELPVLIAPRQQREALFPPQTTPLLMAEVIELLQEATMAVVAPFHGEDLRVPPVLLKGSLASHAVLGGDLAALVQEGSDIDLQMDAFEWLGSECSSLLYSRLSARIAAVWVLALLHRQPPSLIAQHLTQPQIDLVLHNFFVARVLVAPARRPESEEMPDCWTLWQMRVLLPGGAESSIDVTTILRSKRQFLCADAAFQVLLPVGGHESATFSWVSPQEGLQLLESASFSIPRLAEVERGALEKVIVKLARGAQYRWQQLGQEQRALIQHFEQSCQLRRSPSQGGPWQQVAQERLLRLMEGTRRPSQRWLMAAQCTQIFPDWAQRGWWPEQADWPASLHPLYGPLLELAPELQARLFAGLAPVWSGALAQAGWPALPAWSGSCSGTEFLDWWLSLPADDLCREVVRRLPLQTARTGVEESLWQDLFGRLAESPAAGQDAALILSLLGGSQIETLDLECLAAQCLARIDDPVAAHRLLAPWPRLQRCCEKLLAQHPKNWARRSESERWGMLLGWLAPWPLLSDLLDALPKDAAPVEARQNALWNALACNLRRGKGIVPHLLLEALGGVQNPDRQRSALPVLLDAALNPALHDSLSGQMGRWLVAWLRSPLDPSLRSREGRAWLVWLPSLDEALQAEAFPLLLEACSQRRWGELSHRIRALLADQMALGFCLGPSHRSCDEVIRLLQRFGGDDSLLWDALPAAWIAQSSLAAGMALCRRAHASGSWGAPLLAWLAHRLQRPEECLEMIREGLEQGWPLDPSWHWQIWLADLEGIAGRDGLPRAAETLLERVQSAQAAPTAAQTERLLGWLQRTAGQWASGKRPRRGQPAGLFFQQVAQMWAQKWGSPVVQLALQQCWGEQIGRAASTSSAELELPAGVDARSWLEDGLRLREHVPALDALAPAAVLRWIELAMEREVEGLHLALMDPLHPWGRILCAADLSSRRRLWHRWMVLKREGLTEQEVSWIEQQVELANPNASEGFSLEMMELWARHLSQLSPQGRGGWIGGCFLCWNPDPFTANAQVSMVLLRQLRLLSLEALVTRLIGAAPVVRTLHGEGAECPPVIQSSLSQKELWMLVLRCSSELVLAGESCVLPDTQLEIIACSIAAQIRPDRAVDWMELGRCALAGQGLVPRVLTIFLEQAILRSDSAEGAESLVTALRQMQPLMAALRPEPTQKRYELTEMAMVASAILLERMAPADQEDLQRWVSGVLLFWEIGADQPKIWLAEQCRILQEASLARLEQMRGGGNQGPFELREMAMLLISAWLQSYTYWLGIDPEQADRALSRLEGHLNELSGRLPWVMQRLNYSVLISYSWIARRDQLIRDQQLPAPVLGDGMPGSGALSEWVLHTLVAAQGACNLPEDVAGGIAHGIRQLLEDRAMASHPAFPVLKLMASAWAISTKGSSGELQTEQVLDPGLFGPQGVGHRPGAETALGQAIAASCIGHVRALVHSQKLGESWQRRETQWQSTDWERWLQQMASMAATSQRGGMLLFARAVAAARDLLTQQLDGGHPESQAIKGLFLRGAAEALLHAWREQTTPGEDCAHDAELFGTLETVITELTAVESAAGALCPPLVLTLLAHLMAERRALHGRRSKEGIAKEQVLAQYDELIRRIAAAQLEVKSMRRSLEAYSLLFSALERIFQGGGAALDDVMSHLLNQLGSDLAETLPVLIKTSAKEDLSEGVLRYSSTGVLMGLCEAIGNAPVESDTIFEIMCLYAVWIHSTATRLKVGSAERCQLERSAVAGRLVGWLSDQMANERAIARAGRILSVGSEVFVRSVAEWAHSRALGTRNGALKAALAALEKRAKGAEGARRALSSVISPEILARFGNNLMVEQVVAPEPRTPTASHAAAEGTEGSAGPSTSARTGESRAPAQPGGSAFRRI